MSEESKGLPAKIKEYFQNNPKAVRLAVIAVIALALLSYGGIEFTSRPGFCINCHEMKPAYDNWKTSVHSEVTCYDCHMEPGIVNLVTHKVKAMKELYLHFTVFSKPNPPKIHAQDLSPINDACGKCHSFNREMAFGGGLNVPHKKHIDKGLSCPDCHSKVVHGEPDQRKPKMETCFTCHDGKKAPDKCGVCHTKMATPDSHRKANWLSVHGQMAKTINCGKCHKWRPDWCMQCHQKKPKSHEVRWRANHGKHAKDGRKGCNACHKPDFCMRCHGVAP